MLTVVLRAKFCHLSVAIEDLALNEFSFRQKLKSDGNSHNDLSVYVFVIVEYLNALNIFFHLRVFLPIKK